MSPSFSDVHNVNNTVSGSTTPDAMPTSTSGISRNSPHKFGTLAIHAGSPHDPVTGAVIAPVSIKYLHLIGGMED